MDFNDTASEAKFRQEVRAWLTQAAPAFHVAPGTPLEVLARRGREWQREKSQSGYGALALPTAVGGRDAPPNLEGIFSEEEARLGVPVGPYVQIGTQLVVPTVLAHGTPEQKSRFVAATLKAEVCWCQLFSEPGAGSDLAGLRTRAVKDGDGWVVNGQKVWTSWAQVADWGILLVRTDPEVAKHRGITCFLLDMKTPGIEVRPIQQISGEPEFNEVFLTDVRIPDHCRLGAVNAGWKVAMTTLMNERGSIGGESSGLPTVTQAIEFLRSRGHDLAPHRLRLAQLAAREQGLKYFRARLLTILSRGESPGAEAALGKLVYAKLLQELCGLVLDIDGLNSLYAEPGDPTVARFQHGYFWAAALRIAGGTDEILRNQIAERVLGLPGDLRVDKDAAFNAIPTGR